ncbi:mCG144504, partial [Mus musculus]
NCYRKIIRGLKYTQFIFPPSICKNLMAFLTSRWLEICFILKRKLLRIIKMIRSEWIRILNLQRFPECVRRLPKYHTIVCAYLLCYKKLLASKYQQVGL